MKYRYYISYRMIFPCVFLLGLLGLSACSSGPAEKPLASSITSPAQLLDRGIQQYNENNYQKAIIYFEKALFQYRSIDNQTGIVQCSLNLAKSLMAFNNNQLASEYLGKAESIIEQEGLDQFDDHLSLLKSSLAIKNADHEQALQELTSTLNSTNSATQLAAIKNRTKIAFLKDDSDKKLWLEKYKLLQKKYPDGSASHLARIYRFEAELTNDEENKTKLLTKSLTISQHRAARTAIAATLTQWSDIDVKANKYEQAKDKSLRALLIRHQLGDVKNSIAILEQLKTIYSVTDKEMQKRAEAWITKLSNNQLNDWEMLFSDFDNYPSAR